ncbi:class II fumarate hydratase [Thermaerobacter sp. FW80]|uniref:class II fumarate hydratase n=1 Tax=Thermaerobacter sp. FW80 TaxID=2546351 RepID=UPI000DB825C8|nr:class II fumarate hydratase [Thermaerobacter sp. FW80]PZN09478.1 MAG: aspartate ammonia-lyase [Bacillota bacterium]QBS38308.1 class II fumarate hydratase [Thermaerobacter sp. FW80]
MAEQAYRIERDSMGAMRVPAAALYGAQTQRAVENFPISGIRFPRPFIRALGLIKRAAAETNAELGLLDRRIADAIVQAADEVIEGKLDDHFVLDIFQTGSGTSTNMNANEVIANRAIQILGGELGSRSVHPNDHVNMGQSSNDVIPSAIHIAALEQIERKLIPALEALRQALAEKAKAFDDVIKIGRTHLQDATPIRLGQEFSGYASMVEHGLRRLRAVREHLAELALGGTAVGTGINTHPEFPRRTIARIAEATGLPFREAENHFEAQGSRDAVVEASGQLRTVATSLMKIANDIRWLGSGPRCGIGEILIPPTQPGSSIMPGKVNPVMSEMLMMVCAQVIGNDTAIAVSNTHGNFELNVMMPVMAHNLLQSIEILANGVATFTERCVRGIEANRERCEALIEGSLAMVTSLVPRLGYDTAAEIAKEAYATGRTVRQLVLEKGLLSEEEAARLLDPRRMTEPGRAE